MQEEDFQEDMIIEDIDDDPDFGQEDNIKDEKEQVEDKTDVEVSKDNRGFMETKKEQAKSEVTNWKCSAMQSPTVAKEVNIDASKLPLTTVRADELIFVLCRLNL